MLAELVFQWVLIQFNKRFSTALKHTILILEPTKAGAELCQAQDQLGKSATEQMFNSASIDFWNLKLPAETELGNKYILSRVGAAGAAYACYIDNKVILSSISFEIASWNWAWNGFPIFVCLKASLKCDLQRNELLSA